MLQAHSFLWNYLWVAPNVLVLSLGIILSRRREFRSAFPAFVAFAILCSLADLAAFAADVPEERTKLMAATQRPIAQAAFSDVSGPVAWKTLPSWAIIATEDVGAGSDIVRSMAQRAGAKLTELKGSHEIMISQPQAVADVIFESATSVSQPAPHTV